ncbi:RHS repeat domain-containing protein [Leptospira noguchii]|uniref:RHS repeat domain-containing protein n=1 Tax=Leptospira noguchii TaxID=28182 RepID=UPI001FB575C8|nr:RHS repeat-associated core domain-containing protein [Leptospira noguchii]UOG32735.1 RHS repeat-associated core domain-containing protein [Leptospira noguchii]
MPRLSMDRRGRDRSGVNKLGLKVIFWLTFLSFNLLTGAESPVSEKQERSGNVEYNETLKYKTTFLRKPPYLLITSQLIPSHSKSEFGQTANLTLGNGITTSYGYDVKGRMVRLNSSGNVGGNAKTLQDVLYSFNPNNNITNIANNTTDFNTQYDYGYDGLGRLTSANGSYLGIADGNLSRRFQQSFEYSKNGNLSSKRIHDPASGNITDEWSYQYTNHQVTNIDSSRTGADALTLQYDANGNLTRQRDNVKDLTKRISVDSQDRITQIQDGNNAILGSYWYDESGFRIRRSALEPKNSQFTNVEILYPSKFFGLEFIESENVITSVNNVYLNGVRIAALNEAGALAYYLTDQVDSVSTVLDDEGNTLSQLQYLPYGETFVQRGDLNFSPKYNSQELDRESGFYFFNARYYDPGIARFTSADTIIDGEFDTQGWNRFSYVKGNPIGAKDPSGHDTVIFLWGPKNSLDVGHAGVAVEEYDKNGKSKGTYQYKGLWPEKGYQKTDDTRTTRKELVANMAIAKDNKSLKEFTEREGRSADAIYKIKSNNTQDQRTTKVLDNFIKKNEGYNAETRNCTTFCAIGASSALGKKLDTKETILPNNKGELTLKVQGQGGRTSISFDSPTKLNESIRNSKNVETIKDPGDRMQPILQALRK